MEKYFVALCLDERELPSMTKFLASATRSRVVQDLIGRARTELRAKGDHTYRLEKENPSHYKKCCKYLYIFVSEVIKLA